MLGRDQIIAVAVALSLFAGFAAGWAVNGWRLNAKLARAEAQHAQVLEKLAQATVESSEAARAEEARRTAAVEEQRDIAQKQNEALAADVAAGAAVSDRLREQLNALRARAGSGNSAPSDRGQGEQGTDAIGLLIDVLTGMDSAGREIAEYADRMKIAGLACERTYDGVRGAQ